ncbi:hypothetical protein HHI36_011975 [Cryptolaemus montrouzieri]|uniref:Sushi domain-containing protein n=1 Tax=Cryptolaemus montrouzieri TaxID=559131 RepID=A0ABD2NCW7_9CUCU
MFCLFATNLWLRNEQVLLKYVPFCRVNIIVILFVLTSSEARKYCHGEYSIIKNSNDTALWVDYHYSDSPVVFSNPSCLNAKGESVKRICHNGSWIPEATPLCDRVTNNDHCPESFYEYRTFCIAKFDEHMIGNSTLKSKIPTTKNNTKLRTCDKFKSNTIAYTLSESFQLKVENSSRLEKYCNGTSYVVVPFDHRFHLCPENCVPSDLTSEKCFCKVTEAKHNKLARVRDILQKKLLSQLAGSDICRIDSNSPSELCNCYPVITHNFYGYTLNTTNCSIIETKALKNDEIDSPSLSLSFNERKRKLILLIESPKGLSTSKYATVKCYTNAGTDRIRNIRIREIKSRNRHSSKDFLVYDLSLENTLENIGVKHSH